MAILFAILFNVPYAVLAATFEYPDVLRKPAGEALALFGQGGAGLSRDDSDLKDLALGGSIFLSADTQLGPVYLAYGRSEDDRQSLYLFVGRPF